MDLISEKWIPVSMKNGAQEKVSLLGILGDDIVDFAYPRADFQIAAWQFVIGVMQCTVAPRSRRYWNQTFEKGIDAETWQSGLQNISAALKFGTTKPSFMQSLIAIDKEPMNISSLLVGTPGENTLKNHADFFIKKVDGRMCQHCAAMGLFAAQVNAPAGGAGYRASLRGPSHITTLITSRDETAIPLWKKLWLNVLVDKEPLPSSLAEVFPWLAETKTSKNAGSNITPDNTDCRQAYWGMPQHLEIDLENLSSGRCMICGCAGESLICNMRKTNYGINYTGWHHPLSPYKKSKTDDSIYASKVQAGGVSYRDWAGLMYLNPEKDDVKPAKSVLEISPDMEIELGLWCFAWHMDNAKALGLYQSKIPFMPVKDSKELSDHIGAVTAHASESLSILRTAVKAAFSKKNANAKEGISHIGGTEMDGIGIAFWNETEPMFTKLLQEMLQKTGADKEIYQEAIATWEKKISAYIFDAYDRLVMQGTGALDKTLHERLKQRKMLKGKYDKLKTGQVVRTIAGKGDKKQ